VSKRVSVSKGTNENERICVSLGLGLGLKFNAKNEKKGKVAGYYLVRNILSSSSIEAKVFNWLASC
jgi:hypothetical protein